MFVCVWSWLPRVQLAPITDVSSGNRLQLVETSLGWWQLLFLQKTSYTGYPVFSIIGHSTFLCLAAGRCAIAVVGVLWNSLIMRAVMTKEFQELLRDRRTLMLIVAMPLLLLIIFGYAANFNVETLNVAILGDNATQLQSNLEANENINDKLNIVRIDDSGTEDDAKEELVTQRANAAIYMDKSGILTAYIDGSNLFAAQTAQVMFAKASEQTAETPNMPPVKTEVLFNPDLKTSWVMVPAIVGLILTFIGTIITSIGLVREREAGTLEQLAIMPLKASGVVLGKITPYFILASVDMTLITLLGMWLFKVPFNGNVLIFIIGAALFLFVVLGIGVLISSFSRTSGQAIQLAMMTLLPQILLSGMIFPLDSMASGVRWIGYLLPLTYFTIISQGVMLRGTNWVDMSLPIGILILMAIVFFGIAVFVLHRSISPERPKSSHKSGSGAKK
jgi:ABC-type multidrug transport system, permease component